MTSQLTLSRSTFAEIFDRLFVLGFPNPDDSGPIGPAGPVISPADLVALNPSKLVGPEVFRPRLQPWGPSSEPWGTHPEPWRSIAATRAAIDRALGLMEMAGIIIVSGDIDRAVELASAIVSRFVDEFCGTPPRKGPFPGPWGPVLDTETLHPLNLVIAGIQCQKASDALGLHPLQSAINDAADRLLETGLGRLADHRQRTL
jgi:hypothetical protein